MSSRGFRQPRPSRGLRSVPTCPGDEAVPSRYKAPMPRMLPPRPDADTPDSERKVFTAFERHLPRDWTVFHSRRFVLPRQGGGPTESELDFLVIDPARGILGLEVKGGIEIGRDEEGWYSGTSPRHRIKSPGAQAQRAMHTLQDYLRTRASVPAFGWGVVFPDAEAPESLGPELPRRLVIDASSLQWADKAVDSVFEAAMAPAIPSRRRPSRNSCNCWRLAYRWPRRSPRLSPTK